MTSYVPTCRDDSSIAEVEKILLSGESGPFSVVDRDGKLLGILRGSDIREATNRFGRVADHILACDAMLKDGCACLATDDIEVALSRMRSSGFSRLPVVDALGKLIGAIFVVDPELEESRESPDGTGEGPDRGPEPTVVSHRSPTYVEQSGIHQRDARISSAEIEKRDPKTVGIKVS